MFKPIILTILVGYLLGNLNGSITISNLIAHDDVRSHGSGNAGITNYFRNYGGWNTLLAALIDVGKAVIACLAGGLMMETCGYYREGLMLGGVAVSLGHDFPALQGFRGGKGILCGVTVSAVMDWRIALCAFLAFALMFAITHYVSLGSVVGAVAVGATFAIFQHQNPWIMAGGIFLAVLALIMHRQNIVRLIKGTESKVYLRKKRDRA